MLSWAKTCLEQLTSSRHRLGTYVQAAVSQKKDVPTPTSVPKLIVESEYHVFMYTDAQKGQLGSVHTSAVFVQLPVQLEAAVEL